MSTGWQSDCLSWENTENPQEGKVPQNWEEEYLGLFECLETYKEIINDEEYDAVEEKGEGKNTHVFVNVSASSNVSCIAGTMACMMWKGTSYYAHIEYNDKTDPDGLPDEMLAQ